jgi:glycosyltransferase involved in cell wall biosynthesis
MSIPVSRDDVLVVQLTGRMHFGAARGLERCGRLAGLVTDFHLPQPFKPLAFFSSVLKSYDIDLPARKVHGNPLIGLDYRRKLRRHGHFRTETHIEASAALARQAGRLLERIPASTVYSFDIQALETFQACANRQMRLILEQCVAPRRSQMEVLDRLRSLSKPGDYDRRKAQLSKLSERETEEWSLADDIVCPSGYVRDELVRWGVPNAKIEVIPYGFSRPPNESDRKPKEVARATPHAMFVGTVDPRKGLQDVLAAMRTLDAGSLHLDVFGNLGRIDPADYAAPAVTLHGKVPFEQVRRAYAQADMFVLPSYLEGSATVVYEAMSYGLPCVVTPETGSVVRDGIEGFVVPAGDIDRIAECLERLGRFPALRARMGRAAIERAQEFTFEKYGERLARAI